MNREGTTTNSEQQFRNLFQQEEKTRLVKCITKVDRVCAEWRVRTSTKKVQVLASLRENRRIKEKSIKRFGFLLVSTKVTHIDLLGDE